MRWGVVSARLDCWQGRLCLSRPRVQGWVCLYKSREVDFKVGPHFKIAINSERGHADGCAYEVECKNPVVIRVEREKTTTFDK